MTNVWTTLPPNWLAAPTAIPAPIGGAFSGKGNSVPVGSEENVALPSPLLSREIGPRAIR